MQVLRSNDVMGKILKILEKEGALTLLQIEKELKKFKIETSSFRYALRRLKTTKKIQTQPNVAAADTRKRLYFI